MKSGKKADALRLQLRLNNQVFNCKLFSLQINQKNLIQINSKNIRLLPMNYGFILLLFIFKGLNCQIIANERNIWVYWSSPIESAPIITQLCYEKMKTFSQQNNWKLTLLNGQNLHVYLSKYQEIEYFKRNNILSTIQAFSDLIRLTILEQHGGIYFDISIILHQGLNWIDQLQKYEQFITNVVHNQKPQVILFYVSAYEHRTQYHNNQGSLVNFLPGYEGWFIYSKPHTKLITGWRNTFIELSKMNINQTIQRYEQEDIYLRNIQYTAYLNVNKAAYLFLSQQQKKLDKNLSLFQSRKNINSQLKIWGIHGEFGPLAVYLEIIPDYTTYYSKTVQQVKQEYFQQLFFLKLVNSQRFHISENVIQRQIEYKRQYATFQEFIQSQPPKQDCQKRNFIVNNSYISRLIQNNHLEQKLDLFFITTEQRDLWNKYCLKYNDIQKLEYTISWIQNFIKSTAMRSFLSPKSMHQSVKLYNNSSLNIYEQIKLILYINRFNFFLFFLSFSVLISTILILHLFVKVFAYVIGIIQTQKLIKQTQYLRQQKQGEQAQDIDISTNNKQLLLKPKHKSQLRLLVVYLFNTSLSILFYYYMDQFGQINQQYLTLIVISISFCVNKVVYQNYIKKQTLSSSMLSFKKVTLQDAFYLFKSLITYYNGKIILLSIQYRQELIVPHTIFIFLIGEQLFRVGQKLVEKQRSVNSNNNQASTAQNQQQADYMSKNNPKTNSLLSYLSKYRYINDYLIFGFLFLLVSIPNLKFIIFQTSNSYFIRNVIYLPLIYVTILYFSVLYDISRLFFISNYSSKLSIRLNETKTFQTTQITINNQIQQQSPDKNNKKQQGQQFQENNSQNIQSNDSYFSKNMNQTPLKRVRSVSEDIFESELHTYSLVKFIFLSTAILACYEINCDYFIWLFQPNRIFLELSIALLFGIVSLANLSFEIKNKVQQFNKNPKSEQQIIKQGLQGDIQYQSEKKPNKLKFYGKLLLEFIILHNLVPLIVIFLIILKKSIPYKSSQIINKTWPFIFINCILIILTNKYREFQASKNLYENKVSLKQKKQQEKLKSVQEKNLPSNPKLQC